MPETQDYSKPRYNPGLTVEIPSKTRGQNIPPVKPVAQETEELRLLISWPNPFAVFVENLFQRLFWRVTPKLETSSSPDFGFWQGVDLGRPVPIRGLFDSALAHAALLGLLYAISIWPHTTAHLSEPLARLSLRGYTISEYLPELHGAAPTHRLSEGKRDPAPAKQEITSLPETPDNLRQTIVVPPKVNLDRNVALPNIVAYVPAAPVQPLALSAHEAASLRLPAFPPAIVQPTAETGSLRSASKVPSFQPMVVEPAPDLAHTTPRLSLPPFQPRVVEPAPELGGLNATANFAHLAPRVAEPIPEPPPVADAQHGSGQVIALNLHPAEVHAPVDLPSGNRRGAFAASATGRPEATGAPGTDTPSGASAQDSTTAANAPAGIHVSPAAPSAPVSAPNSISSPGAGNPDANAKLMAAMHPPLASIPPRQPMAHETTAPRSDIEKRVFAGRRSYSLQVNMPNLNAVVGSWIIHFAERVPTNASSPIAAPEVISKADPAYPGDAIRDGVQGTVILTAIIRADGSVAEIAVAKSLDPRLDRNAVQALSRWLFRPALKDGHAIDLQAVISVPFRPSSTKF